jgi:hypothetical protein
MKNLSKKFQLQISKFDKFEDSFIKIFKSYQKAEEVRYVAADSARNIQVSACYHLRLSLTIIL